MVKNTPRIALFLFFAGLCLENVSARQAVEPDSKGEATLTNLSKPVYPALARQANIWGDVRVTVTVHPDGSTETALEGGHPMLRQAALDSAAQSHFACRMCTSPIVYTLIYAFKQIEGGACCSAISEPVAVEQQPPSTDQQGRAQTRVVVTAKQICLCDPAANVTRRTRSIKCLYLWRCSGRKRLSLQ
jgi:hypothetical protein